MAAYILRRLLLVIPTLFGIMVINFVVVQFAPGGPVEQMIAEIRGQRGPGAPLERVTGSGQETAAPAPPSPPPIPASRYRGARGLDPEIIAEIERMFGFDRPPHERFARMMVSYLTFDFGESFFRTAP